MPSHHTTQSPQSNTATLLTEPWAAEDECPRVGPRHHRNIIIEMGCCYGEALAISSRVPHSCPQHQTSLLLLPCARGVLVWGPYTSCSPKSKTLPLIWPYGSFFHLLQGSTLYPFSETPSLTTLLNHSNSLPYSPFMIYFTLKHYPYLIHWIFI